MRTYPPNCTCTPWVECNACIDRRQRWLLVGIIVVLNFLVGYILAVL